jgi:vancomycin permeability regulator SanA
LTAALLLAVVLFNAGEYYWLLRRGDFASKFPLPFSLLLAAGLLTVIAALGKPPGALGRWGLAKLLASLAVLAVLFPLVQILCFGKTDYRRQADAAIVFGARAYADGTCSEALTNRVATAVKLYHDGSVGRLIMSGGPGDGAVTEPQAMRDLAVRLGVPAERIVLDESGLNTRASVQNVHRLLDRMQAHRLLAVSHFYHLPRVKMAFQRQGLTVYTVPAEEPRMLSALPVLIAREVGAIWAYYLWPAG